MHFRGPAAENKDYVAYKYAWDEASGRSAVAVAEGVRVELGAKVERAVKGPGGIRRWLVIVDPGIGFSKTLEGNFELLRDVAAIIVSEYPRVRFPNLMRRENHRLVSPQLTLALQKICTTTSKTLISI